MTTLAEKYILDRTGINPDNLIENEIHSTIDLTTGILIPFFRNFFTESLIVKNSLNEILERNIDYVPIEFNQQASLLTGKEICTAIVLITNVDGNPITITYQVLGGPSSYGSDNLIAAYTDKVLPDSPIPWDEITDKPIEFSPVSHHLHDSEEIYGLEYVVKQLNRILTAIQVGSYSTLESLIGFIDTSLIKIKADAVHYLNENMSDRLEEFKNSFTKGTIGIDQIQNLLPSTEKDGYAISKINFNRNSIEEDKYVLLETLIGFKRGIYENFIRKDLTGLDLNSAKYGVPASFNLKNLSNGGIYNTISKSQSIETDTTFTENFYPDTLNVGSETSVLKLSNSLNSNDSDFLLVDRTNLNVYWGTLIEQLASIDLNWKLLILFNRIGTLGTTIYGHIADNLNPHHVTKAQINLELVENLPVVTETEVNNLESVRSYITFDTLLLFARKHFLQNGPGSPADPEYRNRFIVDNAVVVFSPAGKPSTTIIDPKVFGLDGVFPINSSIGWSINNGAPGGKFTVKHSLIGGPTTTKNYVLGPSGNYIGHLNTGTTVGLLQSIFTFSGGHIIVTNSLIQESTCVTTPPPPPPVVTPPPPIIPPPEINMIVTPSTVNKTADVGQIINELVGQVYAVKPTGVITPLTGTITPGIVITVGTDIVGGSYPITMSGAATVSGVNSASFRIMGENNKNADFTVNTNIVALKVPKLALGTSSTNIYFNNPETITVIASEGQPNTVLSLKAVFTYLSGSYKQIIENHSVTLNSAGTGTLNFQGGNPRWSRNGDGLPLGTWSVYVETVGITPNVKSRTIDRKFYGGTSGTGVGN